MSLNILLADDALFMRAMLRGILQEDGHVIVGEAANGAEAVQRFTELSPDLTLLDIVMPGTSGIEALREIMALDPSACVVMCSAIGQESLVQEAEQAGALDFILKPFSPERVKEVVKRVAER